VRKLRTAGLFLCGIALGTGCHSAPRSAALPVDAPEPPAPVSPIAREERSTVPPPPPPLRPDEVPPVSVVERPLSELGPFYDAIDALRSGRPLERPLRVLWMGDSHTSADFMTHRVRLRLQALGGDGGPGFLRLGLDAYRHEAASFEVSGKWRQEPALPAQRTRVKDGVFGYGGIRTLPQSGAHVRVSVRASAEGGASDLQPPELGFRLVYRLPAGAALHVRLGREERHLAAGEGDAASAGMQVLDLEGSAADALELAHVSGAPEVFGLYVDRRRGGVVLDTVGIDGARAATPLAWEPDQFAQAVAQRAPSLLVLAYGTNEVFDKTAPGQYTEHLRALVARVRAGAGPIPCWIIGPMDAPGPTSASRPRVAEVTAAQAKAAAEEGCAFTSAQALMGGEGSFTSWTTARPQLARTDGIHLTIAGYRRLGDLFADHLLPAAPSPVRFRYSP